MRPRGRRMNEGRRATTAWRLLARRPRPPRALARDRRAPPLPGGGRRGPGVPRRRPRRAGGVGRRPPSTGPTGLELSGAELLALGARVVAAAEELTAAVHGRRPMTRRGGLTANWTAVHYFGHPAAAPYRFGMSEYVAPLADMRFVLENIVDLPGLAKLPGFEHAEPEMVFGVAGGGRPVLLPGVRPAQPGRRRAAQPAQRRRHGHDARRLRRGLPALRRRRLGRRAVPGRLRRRRLPLAGRHRPCRR